MLKTIIYLRTSTEEQNPENQLADCKTLVKDKFELYEEKQSAFKDEDRDIFDGIIRKKIKARELSDLIVWDLDRLYRNRKKLIEFFQFCKLYKCKVHSFRQQWLEDLNKIQEPFNEIMFDLMLQVMGWLAEEESRKKSERVKNAVRIEDGITKSYKGNKWGRKEVYDKVSDKIIELHKQGKKYREICQEVFYWDARRNKKFVSLGLINKVLTDKGQK